MNTETETMTDDDRRFAICLALGWRWQWWGKSEVQVFAPKGVKPRWSGEDKATNSIKWPLQGQSLDDAARDLILRVTPDYLNDLNAMHEAEKTLNANLEAIYYDRLCSIAGVAAYRATAAQRAEAFLMTIKHTAPKL